MLWEANCNIRTTCKRALSTSTYTDYWIGKPLPCQNASCVVCIASFSKTYVDLVTCIAEASWKMNICWSIVRVAKFSPLNSKPCGVITCLAKTNRNPKDFIWVCSIAATQIKVRVWVWICPDIASAIASQNSNNTIKNRKSFRKCYISRTAPRKVGARAPLDRKACGVITWLS